MAIDNPAAAAATHSRLEHFPIGFFAVVMGLAGLTLATLRLEHATGTGQIASKVFLAVTIAAFIAIAITYLMKMMRYPAAVRGDWNHPVRISFVPAITIGLVLIGTAALPVWPAFGAPVWMVGSALHIAVTLAVVSAWISHRTFEAVHLNPAWFIPAVGNILVPIAGMRLGYTEVSWFFFSVGLLFWIVLVTLVFNRLIFHAPLPERLMPTLMILVAPPAVGFVAWPSLQGGLDPFGRILYYGGVLFALIFATQIGKVSRLPFMVTWWAYSFPLAALTISTFVYAELAGLAQARTGAFGLYGLLALAIAVLLARTAAGLARGELTKPE